MQFVPFPPPAVDARNHSPALRITSAPSDHVDTAQATVYVIDDDDSVRQSLRLLIESLDFNVHAMGSAHEFLARFDPLAPGCLILDVRLPGVTGLALLEHLRQTGSQVPAIIITGHGDVGTAVYAMHLGAYDFFEKPISSAIILQRMQQALHTDIARHRQARERQAVCSRLSLLSERERQVLGLAAEGLLNKQIAAQLHISIKTVEAHRARIRGKLGIDSILEMARLVAMAS